MSSDKSSTDKGAPPQSRRARLAQARRNLAAEDRLMLGQLAVERGFLDRTELDEYLDAQRRAEGEDNPHQPIGELLLKDGVLTSSQIVDLLREQRRRNLLTLFQDWTEGAPAEVLKLLTDPARHLDGYILVQQIGAGGMGVVWKAWDKKLRRWVAVKVLHGESDPQLMRFIREKHAAGRLRHPSIVPFHHEGECEGKPYLVMDYIDGGSLEGRLLPPAEAAHIMAQVARAVAYAHKRGVIHRDLKPANLLTDKAGHVYITDFGLAKLGDTASRETVKPADLGTISNAAMGTPQYMPPEQALARPLDIDARSDVYGLGATLYRLVTGQPPFMGNSPAEVILKVMREPPISPRSLRPSIPRTLEAITLKCLEKDRDRRYQSAQMVAEDLERFLRGEPVEARHASMFLRTVSRVKRYKLRLLGAIAVAVVSFVSALLLTSREDSEQHSRRLSALDKYVEAVALFSRYEYGLGRIESDEVTRQLAADGLERINEAIQIDPAFGPLHVAKGRMLRLLERREEALAELEQGIRLAPDYYGGYLERGWYFLEAYGIPRPLPTVLLTSAGTRRLPPSKEPPDIARLLTRALEDLENAVRLGEAGKGGKLRNEGDLLLARAYAALYRDHPEEARELLLELRRRGTHPEDAAEMLGRAAYQMGEFAEAVKEYSYAIALRPRLARLHLGRGGARWALVEEMSRRGIDPAKEAAVTVRDLEEAIRLGANEPQCWLLMAQTRHAQISYALNRGSEVPAEEIEDALAQYTRALQRHPESVSALCGRALLHRALGDQKSMAAVNPSDSYGAAVDDMTAALRVAPDCIPAYLNRGIIYQSMAESYAMHDKECAELLQAAERDYAAVLKLDPSDVEARLGCAEVRMELATQSSADESAAIDEIRAAIRVFDELIASGMKNPEVLVTRGNARRGLGDRLLRKGGSAAEEFRRAIEDYELAAKGNPSEWRIMANLALARLQLTTVLPPGNPEVEEQLLRADKEIAPYSEHFPILGSFRQKIAEALAKHRAAGKTE